MIVKKSAYAFSKDQMFISTDKFGFKVAFYDSNWVLHGFKIKLHEIFFNKTWFKQKTQFEGPFISVISSQLR